jgi:hypothetical protein
VNLLGDNTDNVKKAEKLYFSSKEVGIETSA